MRGVVETSTHSRGSRTNACQRRQSAKSTGLLTCTCPLARPALYPRVLAATGTTYRESWNSGQGLVIFGSALERRGGGTAAISALPRRARGSNFQFGNPDILALALGLAAPVAYVNKPQRQCWRVGAVLRHKLREREREREREGWLERKRLSERRDSPWQLPASPDMHCINGVICRSTSLSTLLLLFSRARI